MHIGNILFAMFPLEVLEIYVFLSASLSMSKKCVLLFIHLLISQFLGLWEEYVFE